ncbi:hypothetical protein ASD25_00545 [Brevundimonas sp. Root1423]|nr:hypothetical protein ASD25_00545 [Brevundimonas sp. Root1423]
MTNPSEAVELLSGLIAKIEGQAWGGVESTMFRVTRTEAEKVALDWLAQNINCEIDFGYDDSEEGDPGCWRVHRVNGGINDREWTLIGQGATPTDAILTALRPPPDSAGNSEGGGS